MTPTQPAKVEGVERRGDEPAPAGTRPAGDRERVSILLVDDRHDKCMAMETALAELGQNIVTARSGNEALRLLMDNDFAVILLDVNMPGLDGFETAYLIRQRKRLEHTPIIFTTGISDTETHVSRGYSLGAVDYILTPVLPDVLRTKVSVFVELFKKNQQLKKQAESLREAHDELEMRVKNRTFQLAVANESLRREIAERERAEESIRHINAGLEQRVLERTAELAATNRELEAFTYSVAHDLQAPLRNIQSYVQLLQEDWDAQLPPETLHYLKRIGSRTKYMTQLISGLLNLSIIGKQGLKRTHIGLKEIVEDIVSSLKAETPGRSIEWKIDELPEVSCDSGLMRQVFTNLLSNAVKYTQPRDPAVIEVGHTKINGETPIYVRDNGVGFNMKYADKLFGVFQRLHPVAEFEGTGIGLAMVERIIRKHEGRVWAEAEEKKGRRFILPSATGTVRLDKPPRAMAKHKYSVLLVDDSEDDRLFVRRALGKNPAFVVKAELCDGEAAIAYLAGEAEFADREKYPYPDVVLLDLKLPKKTGLEVLAWLQTQRSENLRVVVLSGSFLPEDITRSQQLGADAYFKKEALEEEQQTTIGEIEKLLRNQVLAEN